LRKIEYNIRQKKNCLSPFFFGKKRSEGRASLPVGRIERGSDHRGVNRGEKYLKVFRKKKGGKR